MKLSRDERKAKLADPARRARLRGYEAMTILADERVLSTPGFPGE
jgi:hypothetical protein